jgi:hypothetical protein
MYCWATHPMIKQLFVVPELAVKVVTGDTCYSREDGFSAIYAEIALDEGTLSKEVAYAQKSRHFVTFRCAMLDVAGKITNSRIEGGKTVFVLSIEEMEHREKEPNQAAQTTPGLRPSVSDL